VFLSRQRDIPDYSPLRCPMSKMDCRNRERILICLLCIYIFSVTTTGRSMPGCQMCSEYARRISLVVVAQASGERTA